MCITVYEFIKLLIGIGCIMLGSVLCVISIEWAFVHIVEWVQKYFSKK